MEITVVTEILSIGVHDGHLSERVAPHPQPSSIVAEYVSGEYHPRFGSVSVPPEAQATSAMSDLSHVRTPIRQSRWAKLSYRLAILIAVVLAFSAVVTTTFAVRSVQDDMYDQTMQSMEHVHIAVNSLISAE